MMKFVPLLVSIPLFLAAVSAGWFAFEWWWDRRLFMAGPAGFARNIRAAAARELLRAKPAVQVLDVRSAAEYARGRLPRAVNLPLGDPAFRDRARHLQREAPVLVYCAGGFRSRKAVPILRQLGFREIHHLHRGYHSWQFAGYGVEQ